MICRDPCVGAAGQTAPTNGLQPPLEMLFDVVNNVTCTSNHKNLIMKILNLYCKHIEIFEQSFCLLYICGDVSVIIGPRGREVSAFVS